jgi:hypothetical protein
MKTFLIFLFVLSLLGLITFLVGYHINNQCMIDVAAHGSAVIFLILIIGILVRDL